MCALLALLSLAMADHPPTKPAVTEYEDAARRLILLLDEPHAATVSPDGSLLATGHDNGSIVLWNTETGLPVRSLEGHADTVVSLAFNATGSQLASAGVDAAIRVWNMNDEAVQVLEGHTNRLTTVAFSPDGSSLASGGYDRTVRLWNLHTA